MKKALIVAAIALAAVGVFAAGFYTSARTHTVPGALLTRLDSLGLEPHPSISRYVEAGAVYLPGDLRSPYPAATVFKAPEALRPEPATPFGKSRYLDRLEAETKSSVLLGYLGLQLDESTKRIRTVESVVEGLVVSDIRMDAFANAAFTDAFQAKLDPTCAIVAAQSVGVAKACTLRLLDETSLQLKLKDSGIFDVFSSRSEATSSEESFEGFSFASKPALRVGGSGSELTSDTAAELGERLQQAGIDARHQGNTVWASLAWKQVPLALQLAQTMNAANSVERTLRAELDTKEIALRESLQHERETSVKLITLELEAVRLAERTSRLERERDSLVADRQLTEQSIMQLQATNAEVQARLAMEVAAHNDLRSQFQALRAPPIDDRTDHALRAFAAKHPDLISYEPQKGMLTISSDLAFNAGGTDVQEGARAALNSFSQLLEAAPDYQLIIVGHASTKPVSGTNARLSSTELSARRAIGVRASLIQNGVSPARMVIAGWGGDRPKEAGDGPANRRVEVYLTRSIDKTFSGGGD